MTIFLIALVVAVIRGSLMWHRRHARTLSWWFGAAVTTLAILVALAAAFQDFGARKMATALIMPAGLVWCALVLMSCWAWALRRWTLACELTAVALLYSVAGNAWVGAALMAHLERGYPRVDTRLLPPLDAVFVLGGGSDADAELHPQYGSAGDRIAVAAQVYLQQRTQRLVASGVASTVDGPNRNLGSETCALWANLGIPVSAALSIPPATTPDPVNPRTTAEEIAAYAELVKREGWTRIGLVTSAWHMPRAMALAKAAGLDPVAIPADHRGRFPGWSAFHLVPNERGFQNVQWAFKEIITQWAR